MRIMLFAAGGDIGGGKTHILSLAKELSKTNDLRLVCFRKGEMSDEGPGMGIDTVYIDHTKGFKAAIDFAIAQYDEFKPQVIHCHGAKANALGILVKKCRKVPVMTTVHSDPKLDYMGAPVRKYTYGVINAWALRRMDYYVAVAWRMRNLLIDRNFDPQSIFTVYNGLDFEGASEAPRPFKDENDPITVGIAARLNPVKDIPTLLKAFAIAYKEDKRLRLSIAGTGEEEANLKALAADLGIAEVTTFEGWISNMRSYFEKVDINVLSSVSETFPYSLLEGAYEHCPAIASNVGGIPSLVVNGKTGLMFEPGDEKTFAKHILTLSKDQQLRRTLAEALFEKARTEFSLQRMKEDQEKIYETLLRRHKLKGRRRGAVLCGAYGKGNAGDEAILTAILSSLRTVDEDMPFYVMSRDPKQTSKNHSVGSFYIFNLFQFMKALRKTRLFVNGGGTLIQDVTSSRSLYFYLLTLKLAKLCGCKVIMYGCGMGPVNKPFNRRLAARVLNKNADIITVRDTGSLQFLKDNRVEKPPVIRAADPVISLKPADPAAVDKAFAEEKIADRSDLIGFCLRSWKTFTQERKQAVAAAAEYAYKTYGLTPVFLPIEYPKDIEIGKEIAAMAQVPSYVCTGKHTVSETIGMIGSMKLMVGMRLHSLIFAAAAGTPMAGISYDVKVSSFVKDAGAGEALPAETLTSEALIALIDENLKKGSLDAKPGYSRLKELECENVLAAKKLLEE